LILYSELGDNVLNMTLRRFGVLALWVYASTAHLSGQVQIGGGTCSNAVLSGTYFYLITGTVVAGSQFLPYAELGKLIVDGKGSVSVQSTASLSGAFNSVSGSGSYSVQSTCAGSIALTVNSQSETLSFQVINGGQSANVAVSTPSVVAVGRAFRTTASAAASNQCGIASLSGGYGYLLTGIKTISATPSFLYADNGQLISDGNGKLSASSAANLNGVTTQTTGTGTYSMETDCSGTAHISNANGTIDYMFALVQDGQIGLFLASDAGLTVSGSATPQFAAAQQAIVNSGSFAANSLSPGSLFSVFGNGLSQQIASAQSVPLPHTLASTQVLVNGQAAPLIYVGPGQINAQMPLEVTAGTAVSIVVTNSGKSSNAVNVSVASASPGVFTYGNNQAVVQNQDGSLISSTAPAHPGDVLVGYLTGGGPVNPSGPLTTGGMSPSGLSPITSSYSVTVGGYQADVLYFGLTPSLVGVYQVNFKVPALGPGQYNLSTVVNNVPSNDALLSVGQ
jgi:uncharacterized protein (TIGR03437 family)